MDLCNPLPVLYNSTLIHLGSPLSLQGMGHKIKFFLGKQTVLRSTEHAIGFIQSHASIELEMSSLIKYYRDKENVS